jgi:DNA-binding LytR/AlgR family response regulator
MKKGFSYKKIGRFGMQTKEEAKQAFRSVHNSFFIVLLTINLLSRSGLEPVNTIGWVSHRLHNRLLLGQAQYLLTAFKLSSPTIIDLNASAS